MAVESKVSSGFFSWTHPVPREQWDPRDACLQQAAQAYCEVEEAINYTFRDKEQLPENGVPTPKPLADLFESLACAIYFDSNQDTAAVWRTMYPLLKAYVQLAVATVALTT
ncbi:uncharacterized protein LOC142767940 isoform X2 [Rhipicephalus microplus]|uniref:uncharacterized protein LOC142767940 isoform X2 n=1 Tax=Rhipicephalus microplus TaxID=6941 RepID=UPI003F6A9DEB